MSSCPVCGGSVVGDGFVMPLHCEFIDPPPDREADAPLLTCREADDAEMQTAFTDREQRYLSVLAEFLRVLPDEVSVPEDVETDVWEHVLRCSAVD